MAHQEYYTEKMLSGFINLLLTRINFYEDENIMITMPKFVYLICYANNKRPMFDGDMSLKKLNIWVENHLQYPKTLKKAGIQGRVILGFTITKDGELTDVKVRKGVHPLFDAEAIRVIKTTAGHWTGGFDAFTGKPADVTYTYPVIFRLKP